MIHLQFSAEETKGIIDLLKKEIDINPNGFIDIEITSRNEITEKDLVVPTPSWSTDRDF